jgi:hypothetical protein
MHIHEYRVGGEPTSEVAMRCLAPLCFDVLTARAICAGVVPESVEGW